MLPKIVMWEYLWVALGDHGSSKKKTWGFALDILSIWERFGNPILRFVHERFMFWAIWGSQRAYDADGVPCSHGAHGTPLGSWGAVSSMGHVDPPNVEKAKSHRTKFRKSQICTRTYIVFRFPKIAFSRPSNCCSRHAT